MLKTTETTYYEVESCAALTINECRAITIYAWEKFYQEYDVLYYPYKQLESLNDLVLQFYRFDTPSYIENSCMFPHCCHIKVEDQGSIYFSPLAHQIKDRVLLEVKFCVQNSDIPPITIYLTDEDLFTLGLI